MTNGRRSSGNRVWPWVAATGLLACGAFGVLYMQADEARRIAEQQGYVASIAAAAAHLAAGDVREAALRLSNAPPAERRWEWRHLLVRSDESTAVLFGYPPAPMPPDGLSSDTRSRLGFGQDEVFWWDGGGVHVWERAGFIRKAMRGFRAPLLAVDAAGRKAVAVPEPGRAVIVSLDDSSIVTPLSVTDGAPALDTRTKVLFSPAGDRLFATTTTGAVRVFDAGSGAELESLPGASGAVNSLAIDSTGGTLALGLESASPAIVDVRTGTRRELAAATSGAPVLDAAAGLVVTGGASLRVWRAATGDMVKELPIGQATVQTAVFDGSATRLAVGAADGALQIWDVARGTGVRALAGHTAAVTQARFSPDGGWLLTAQQKPDHVRLWNLAEPASRAQYPGVPGMQQGLVSFGGSHHVCVTGSDALVIVWTGGSQRALGVDDSEYGAGAGPRRAPLRAIACSADGRMLASAGFYDEVALTTIGTARRERVFGRYAGVREVAISHDGSRVAASRFVRPSAAGAAGTPVDSGGEVTIWDGATGEVLQQLASDTPLFAPAFSADGRLLLAIVRGRHAEGGESAIRRWRVDSGQQQPDLRLPDHVVKLAVSADGGRLLGIGPGRVHVIDLSGQRVEAALSGDDPQFIDASFLDGSDRVASVSADGTVRFWDAARGTLLVALRDTGDLPLAIGVLHGEQLVAATARGFFAWRAESRSRPDLRARVSALIAATGLLDGVDRAITADAGIVPADREAARRLARVIGEHPYDLEARSTRVVNRPEAGTEAYRLARAQAEAAVRIAPWEPRFWLLAAGAQYRTGDASAAREALARAETLQLPTNLRYLAWKALVLQGARDVAGAREALTRARSLRDRLHDESDVVLALVEEAERRLR